VLTLRSGQKAVIINRLGDVMVFLCMIDGFSDILLSGHHRTTLQTRDLSRCLVVVMGSVCRSSFIGGHV